MQNILIVEDDMDIQELLQEFLQEAGYKADIAGDGVEAVDMFASNPYDLILLDIMLPKIDGFTVCELIRKQSQVPIIMLTALGSEGDQIKGLDLQADDYVTKPFSMPVLLRRIAAVLRRAGSKENGEGALIHYKGLTLDMDGYRVYAGDVEFELTQREFEVLRELLTNQGKALSRQHFLNKLWKYDFYGDERVVDICMLTGCAGNAAAGVQNGTMLSAMPAYDTGTVKDSSTAEAPGSVDWSVYEAYGLSYDEKTGCYTYNGSIVRFFNDPAAGASFTNFFTGTVDIEAKRDADNNLIGIEECSQEVYDLHTKKQENFQGMSIGTEPNVAMEGGARKSNGECLKDYEDYGVSYNSKDGRWYYGGDEIRILVDSEKAFVYSTDEKGICLAVSRDGNHNIAEIKAVSESEAGLLLQANKPNVSGDYTTEEN